MTNEEIQTICKERNVVFHHADTKNNHGNFGDTYLGDIKHKPLKAVVYSSEFGNWSLAIFEDGTNITLKEYYAPMSSYYNIYNTSCNEIFSHLIKNGIQNTNDLVELNPPKPKRKPFKRSRWTIKILRDGKDKSDYCIMHHPDGEFKTRQEARNAKSILVKGKTNNNSWSNFYDETWY